MAVLDDRGTVVGWSERAEDLLGYRPHEALGRAAADFLVDPADRDALLNAIAECERERGWYGVLPVLHRSGRRVELGFRARAVTRVDSRCEWFLVAAPAEQVIQWDTDRSVAH